jgi:MFS family permease
MTDIVPLAFRGQWFSLLNAMWAIGTVTGPMIGAGFAENITWRWIFYVNIPITGLGIVCVFIFLNQAKIPGGIMQKLGRFDWIGSFLFTASATGFLFGLTTGGVMYEWSSWRVLLPLIIGPFGLLAFGFYEFRVAAEPIVNRGVFNNWSMILTYIVSVLHGAILWSLLYFLGKYIGSCRTYKSTLD